MLKMIIDVIAGARPNFMKVAALFAVRDRYPELTLRLIHTGQHYDANMSDVFFEELGLPTPDQHLGVGSGSHSTQTAAIMTSYEACIRAVRPHMIVVVGDVNSTIACALVAAKEGIRVSHVEAGLRSFDRTMPEEINRVLTDSISDLMFASEPSGVANLAREGRPLDAIWLVGHVMIDTLLRIRSKAEALDIAGGFALIKGQYAYVTIHRPSNVDDPEQLGRVCEQLLWLADQVPVIFPVHPRTRSRIEATGWRSRLEARLHLVEPLSYLSAIAIMMHARVVVTDSGGIQEESSVLGVPCLTLRDTTERPITLSEGTNILIGNNWLLFRDCVTRIIRGEILRPPSPIPYWDGKAAIRILDVISGRNRGGNG